MKLKSDSSVTVELISLIENNELDKALRILESSDARRNRSLLEPCGMLQVTLVHMAAWRGYVEILERLDVCTADLDASDKLGRCALHLAVQQGHVEVVRWLLNNGAAVDNRYEVSFLPKDKPYSAVKSATPDTGIGQNLPLPECWGRTALHEAVKAGRPEIVKLLVDGGADVDGRDQRGATPLHLAAVTVNPDDPMDMSCYENIINILVSASASVNVVHPDTGTTALHHAVTLGSTEATKLLLRGGAWPATKSDGNRVTPLHIAAGAGFHETMCLLLSYLDAAQINERDEIGRTPLHAAAYRGHAECVRTLIDLGGNLAAETKTGVTVIDAIFEYIPRPIAFITEILDSRVRPADKTVNQVNLDFKVLAPRRELQMAVVSSLIWTIPCMEQMTILQHPLIEAFLGLKWSRLRRFFFLLVTIHVVFVISLSAYSITLSRGSPYSAIPRRMLFICACILLGHNLLQLLIVPRHYTRQFETWLSTSCVTISIAVAVADESITKMDWFKKDQNSREDSDQWMLQSVGVAILFAWIQMMLLVGRFPACGYYALMFSTVLKNVLKVLLAFIWLIIGFALSFSVLFRHNEQFSESWKAIFKTMVMMMGEYNYDELFPNPSNMKSTDIFLPIIGRIIFLIFVTLSSIVLMNLMIGLAVSDIQGILKESHIRRLLKQAQFIAHLEWVTSHRIFKSCLVPRYLRRMIESRKTIPTEVTLGVLTGYDKKAHGISEEVVDVLFNLASNNQRVDKELQPDSPNGKKKEESYVETMQSTLQDRARENQRETIQTQRLQSLRRKIARRRKSTAL